MKWQDEFRRKSVSAEEAVRRIRSNDRIFISGNGATPHFLLQALARRKDELENVELNHILLLGDDPLGKPEMEGHFRHNSQFVGPADREAVSDGRGDYVPVHLSDIPMLYMNREIPLDVALVHVAPPDEHGFMSLGAECAITKAAVESANLVIAQVNDRMPRTLGDVFVHASTVHTVVECSQPLITHKGSKASDVEKKIAQIIATLIDDGSTLQLGIGAIPDEVLSLLDGKRDLGIHTEMISDGIMRAIERNVVTNKRKTLHAGKVIGTFVLGSQDLYDYVDNNPLFELHPCNYTNNPFVIAQNEKMVAINSAIEIDLTGQVCSDSIGSRVYSGFGGQVDFIRGAAYSKGGKPIIAISSTTKNGAVSRITPQLKPGAGVVTSRADVHYVVTEYGVASLHGKNLRERAEALLQIAHPAFRDELEAEIRNRGKAKPVYSMP